MLLGAVVAVAPGKLGQVFFWGGRNREHHVLQLRTSGNWRGEIDHAIGRGSAARPLLALNESICAWSVNSSSAIGTKLVTLQNRTEQKQRRRTNVRAR